MRDLKYLIIQIKNGSLEPKAIIFNGEFVHSLILSNEMKEKYNIISAGFCKIDNEKIECWGESVSLNLKSREEIDAEIVWMTINNMHFL